MPCVTVHSILQKAQILLKTAGADQGVTHSNIPAGLEGAR